MKRIDPVVSASIKDWAAKAGGALKLDRFIKRRIKPTKLTQVHGVLDTDSRWHKFIRRLIAEHPTCDVERNPTEAITDITHTLPSKKQIRAMSTLMSYPPKPAGMPPSATDEIGSGRIVQIRRLANRIFTQYTFVGATTKRESSLGFPSFKRDFDARQKALFRGLKRTTSFLKKELDFDFSSFATIGMLHRTAILKHVFAILFAVVWRGQPAPPEKSYKAYTINGIDDKDADRSTPWNDFFAFRFRVPVGGAGYENIPFAALNAGIRRSAEDNFPSIFKHHGPNHLSHKVNTFAKGQKVWFVAVDLSQMEYSMSTDYIRVYHEKVDEFLAPAGFDYSRHLYVNNPTASPNFDEPIEGEWGEQFLVTHDFDYDYDDNLGLGNRSGSFIVTDVNKLAGCDCMLELLRESQKNPKIDIDDIESGPLYRLFNLGDDNLFVFKEKGAADAMIKFLADEPLVCGFKIGIEPAPSFLKYYVMYRKGRYEFVKDAATYISNLVVSEHGTNTTAEDIDNLGKDDSTDPGIGYFARQLDYASNELCSAQIKPWFESLLLEELGLKPHEAWPTSKLELDKLVNAHPGGDADSVDAIEYLLKLNPDYVYYKLDAMDIPQEILDRMFLHLSIEKMKTFCPDLPFLYSSRADVPIHAETFDKLDSDQREAVLEELKRYAISI